MCNIPQFWTKIFNVLMLEPVKIDAWCDHYLWTTCHTYVIGDFPHGARTSFYEWTSRLHNNLLSEIRPWVRGRPKGTRALGTILTCWAPCGYIRGALHETAFLWHSCIQIIIVSPSLFSNDTLLLGIGSMLRPNANSWFKTRTMTKNAAVPRNILNR